MIKVSIQQENPKKSLMRMDLIQLQNTQAKVGRNKKINKHLQIELRFTPSSHRNGQNKWRKK